MSFRHPRVQFRKAAHKRVSAGHPWAFSNEIEMDPAAKALAAGTIVTLTDAGGGAIGTAMFNPRTLIAARLLVAEADVAIDAAFIAARLGRALELRTRLYREPFYRLVHAEADGLPGLIVDRFDDVLVVQPNTAGMDTAMSAIVEALQAALAPRAIVLRGDAPSRALEGLPSEVQLVSGQLGAPVALKENGVTYYADLLSGQKTGWFFDQRDNHAFMATLSAGARVLDLYTHTGGFAIACAMNGGQVQAVDSSASALDLATKAAETNGVAARCTFTRSDVFPFLEKTHTGRWDVVIADPPAFVKSRKDLKAGLQGYRKLARLCAGVTAERGFLFIASCSHNANLEDFTAAVVRGLADAGRDARIIRSAGAAPDHPVHPALPESAYLKALVFALD